MNDHIIQEDDRRKIAEARAQRLEIIGFLPVAPEGSQRVEDSIRVKKGESDQPKDSPEQVARW